MKLNFRQGIVQSELLGSTPNFIIQSPTSLGITTSNNPVIVSISHGPIDYYVTENDDVLNAWNIPAALEPKWLYWDIDPRTGVRTFGYTEVEPVHGPTMPTTLIEDLHWYDTTTNLTKVYKSASNSFITRIRVFAARYEDSQLYYFPIGTQVGIQSSNYIFSSGRLAYDDSGKAIRKNDGTFFTTEDQFFVSGAVGQAIKIDSSMLFATAQEAITAFSVVKFSDFGEIRLADYEDIGTAILGIASEDAVFGNIINVATQGVLTNPNWSWTTPNAKLWVDLNGELTETDPNETNPLRAKQVPVARVIASDTILFEQGLGGKGDKGDPGSITGVSPATTTTHGLVKLATAPANPTEAIAVGTNDPRLTDARIPLSHTHNATEIITTPFTDYTSTESQALFQEIGTEIANFRILSGSAHGDTDLGIFTYNIIPDNPTTKSALQSLELESTNHITILGTNVGNTNLGTFSENIIPDNTSVKNALQALETAVTVNAGNTTTQFDNFNQLLAADGTSDGELAFVTNEGDVNAQGVYAVWTNVDYTIAAVNNSGGVGTHTFTFTCFEDNSSIYNKLLQSSNITVNVTGSDGGTNDGVYTVSSYTAVNGVGFRFTVDEAISSNSLTNNGIISFYIWDVQDTRSNLNLIEQSATNALNQIWSGTGETSPNQLTNLGTFTESIFTDNSGIKQLFQQIETIFANFTIPYDIGFFAAGTMQQDTVVGSFIVTRNVTIAASAIGSLAVCGTAPTVNISLDINVNGISVGTVDFLSGSTNGSFTVSSQINLVPGDIIELKTQSTVDITFADVSVTLVGSAEATILNA